MTSDDKLDLLLKGMETIQTDLSKMKSQISELDKKVTGVQLTIENEVNRNIQIVAEGHLDLSRKLNEIIHLASDIKAKQELQDFYINKHETKFREIS